MSSKVTFVVGDKVKRKSGFAFPGIVVSTFTVEGANRVVVECTAPECKGMLQIFFAADVELKK